MNKFLSMISVCANNDSGHFRKHPELNEFAIGHLNKAYQSLLIRFN
jgi:hypothetical protein